jgi:hypothetical protein
LRRAALLALLCFAGCAQILDLQDRTLADDAGVTKPGDKGDAGAPGSVTDPDSGIVTSPACVQYCQLAERLCTKEAKLQLFQQYPTCLAVCSKYSTDPNPNGNTLACRLKLLTGLDQTGSNEAVTTCPGAGPGGGPPPDEPNGASCGTDCEGFCQLRKDTCPQMAGDVDCKRKCEALVDEDIYNAGADFGSGQDTLSCRIAHLSAAALYDATETVNDAGVKQLRTAHCSHSGIRSESQCDFPMDQAPDCGSYCKIVGIACTGDKAVFESNEQCLAFCGQLADGKSKDTGEPGSKRCLRSGAYDALEGLTNGCQRASIAGDGCRGSRVGSYCLFAKKACPAEFAEAYPAGDDECRGKAGALGSADSNSPFSVTSAGTNDNMQCRLRRLLKFFGGDTRPENCAAALGLPGNMFCQP